MYSNTLDTRRGRRIASEFVRVCFGYLRASPPAAGPFMVAGWLGDWVVEFLGCWVAGLLAGLSVGCLGGHLGGRGG